MVTKLELIGFQDNALGKLPCVKENQMKCSKDIMDLPEIHV